MPLQNLIKQKASQQTKQGETAPLAPRFKLFIFSSVGLLISLIALCLAEFYMEPSTSQELIGLIALCTGALTGSLSIIAYLGILWQRLKSIFTQTRQ